MSVHLSRDPCRVGSVWKNPRGWCWLTPVLKGSVSASGDRIARAGVREADIPTHACGMLVYPHKTRSARAWATPRYV